MAERLANCVVKEDTAAAEVAGTSSCTLRLREYTKAVQDYDKTVVFSLGSIRFRQESLAALPGLALVGEHCEESRPFLVHLHMDVVGTLLFEHACDEVTRRAIGRSNSSWLRATLASVAKQELPNLRPHTLLDFRLTLGFLPVEELGDHPVLSPLSDWQFSLLDLALLAGETQLAAALAKAGAPRYFALRPCNYMDRLRIRISAEQARNWLAAVRIAGLQKTQSSLCCLKIALAGGDTKAVATVAKAALAQKMPVILSLPGACFLRVRSPHRDSSNAALSLATNTLPLLAAAHIKATRVRIPADWVKGWQSVCFTNKSARRAECHYFQSSCQTCIEALWSRHAGLQAEPHGVGEAQVTLLDLAIFCGQPSMCRRLFLEGVDITRPQLLHRKESYLCGPCQHRFPAPDHWTLRTGSGGDACRRVLTMLVVELHLAPLCYRRRPDWRLSSIVTFLLDFLGLPWQGPQDSLRDLQEGRRMLSL